MTTPFILGVDYGHGAKLWAGGKTLRRVKSMPILP
jgi:hypothetical protein